MSRHVATHKLSVAAVLIVTPAILLLTGPVQAQFAGGAGTAEDPYQIETVEQLQDVGQEEYRSSHFILVADIDASETAEWNDRKGFEPLRFRGHFDGDGHVITGLTIDRAQENNVGLFGYTYWNSTIKNLGLEEINITGGDHTGGLVGFNDHSVIQSCYVVGQVSGDWMVGGLIAALHSDRNPERYWVMSSYADVRVTGTNDVGGLIGGMDLIYPLWGMMRSVNQSFAVGEVTGEETVGGLMGYPRMAIIHNSYWDVEATTQSEGIADSTGTGFIGLTTEQMTGQNAFIYMNNLDFEDTWQLTEGYPVLRWQDPEDAVEPPFAGGSGTEADPFQIETVEQLQLIDDLHEYHYLLISDIDATETAGWNDGKGFKPARLTGSIDGGGHIISNLYINRPDEYHVGLFGFAEWAKIVNTGLVDVEITGRSSVGGIAGTSYLSDIHNSFVTGSVSGSNRLVGGLVGEFAFFVPSYGKYGEAAVWNCYTDVSVSGDRFIGGLIGGASTFRITPIDDDEYADVIPEFAGIYESFSVGPVTGEHSTGGLLGGGYPEYIESNYWDRESSGQNQWDGGDDDSQSATGLSTEQMTGQNAFIHMYELDFEHTWQLTEGYPVLRWQDPEDAVVPPEVPIIRVDTTKRDFGVVSTDSSGTVEVTIRNSGNNVLNGEVFLTGPDAGLFAIADVLSAFSMDAGSSQDVAIIFRPESLESYEAELHIVHDAPNRNDTLIISLSGEGKEPTDARPDPGPDLPGELALHQNYPNPFNPSTVITYRVPSESRVQLTIYDVTGRRVNRLVDEMQTPGEYRAVWDASEMASGIYLYRLSASGHTLTRRMTLIR